MLNEQSDTGLNRSDVLRSRDIFIITQPPDLQIAGTACDKTNLRVGRRKTDGGGGSGVGGWAGGGLKEG